ncbi:hypothetical protein NKH18_02475 [Streptomyces sp. M10(2022)]
MARSSPAELPPVLSGTGVLVLAAASSALRGREFNPRIGTTTTYLHWGARRSPAAARSHSPGGLQEAHQDLQHRPAHRCCTGSKAALIGAADGRCTGGGYVNEGCCNRRDARRPWQTNVPLLHFPVQQGHIPQ